ncbi:endonuclease Q family protein [Thermosediminibacter oceani]|uniref:PHP domain protein n=1 Tax=Thermosediminibacter oceani (strain ATCC BAA-1034 / DSM 16646 / JW/IW-1228P) TaxID=555079 RepID=D9S3Q2_THEOJ|nr:endonuclease Q family protein [Thermosediminibacter oceani]ADL08029.1 PHP domain protein [Thermosediminibacter oceani DSM 16646]
MEYFADLHVHIGQACSKPVKVTASRQLTLDGIIRTCMEIKGIDIVGLVDCASPYVLREIKNKIDSGELIELSKGGLSYRGNLTLILGSEVETQERGGVAHSVAYFPSIAQMEGFSNIMSKFINNIGLSSQKARLSARELLSIVKDLGGKLVPAHVFTPFKSFYGSCYERMSEAFEERFNEVTAVELGLSADTQLADRIKELSGKQFVSNSDAHSLNKIGREYNIVRLDAPDFENLFEALEGKSNRRRILANYGLDPRLGKYHRTCCLSCNYIAEEPPPVSKCPRCSSEKVVMGVLDRITFIADYDEAVHPRGRPPYYHQVPLEFIPGVGKKTLERLLKAFGNEMNIIHHSDPEELRKVVGEAVTEKVLAAREGKLKLKVGGGGVYGKIVL